MRFILLFLFLDYSLCSFSQTENLPLENKNYPAIALSYHYGNVMPTTEFVRGDNLAGKPISHYQSLSLKMLWQNPGYRDWQKVYRCPYYGFGFFAGDFFSRGELGYPMSMYGILGIPLKRWQNAELYSEFQFGLAWNWHHYDSVTNPKNFAVGGGMTVHLDIGVSAFYHISRTLDLGTGLSFTHFSNGGFERPNRGLNLYSPFLELKYHPHGRSDVRSVQRVPRNRQGNQTFLMLGYGNHQLVEHELDTNYFAIGGLSGIYFFQLSNAFRLGTGADLNYWFGLNAAPDGTIGPRRPENFTLGFIVQPEFAIGKLTLTGGYGIYAFHRNYGNFQQTYQRLGARYEFIDNVSLGVNVRAINLMLAEFLEFNLGYTFR
ncbi:MAG: acyloxyacyl hydrolase [Bacteroidota bacterium]